MSFGIIAFFLCVPLLWYLDKCRTAGERNTCVSVLRAALIWSLLIVLLTEILSPWKALSSRNLAVAWSITAAVLLIGGLVLEIRKRRRRSMGIAAPLASGIHRDVRPSEAIPNGKGLRDFFGRIESLTALDFLYWAFLFVWFATLLVIALVAAPNNYDSMTYHLPRVMHWAENHSVAFFPTQVTRQNGYPPFAEWTLLHMFLLTRSDRIFNLLQLLSLAGSCVAVHEIAGLFSERRLVKRMAVVLAASTPMAILQATSTQNDLVVSFFFLCFLFFGLRMSTSAASPSQQLENALFCGVALGLALLTKTTILLFAGIFSFWLGLRLIRSSGWRAFGPGVACAIVALLIVSGHSLRNLQLFEHPLGPRDDMLLFANERMNGAFFGSNVIRNAAIHLQTSTDNFNDFVVWAVWRIHEWIGLTPNTPEITLRDHSFSKLYDLRHEDFAGNFPQTVLMAAALLVLPFRRRRVSSLLPGLAICALTIIVAFCLVFRWQPFHSRLELPLFLALCPLTTAVLFADAGTAVAAGIAGFCVCHALPYVTDNYTRPLFGPRSIFVASRESQYFHGDAEQFQDFRTIVQLIKEGGYRSVGLVTGYGDYHYPIWPMLRRKTKRRIALFEVNVGNPSERLGSPPLPEAVVVTHPSAMKSLDVQGRRFDLIWSGTNIALFAPDSLEATGAQRIPQ